MSILTPHKHRTAPTPESIPADVSRRDVINAIVADKRVAKHLGYVPSTRLAAGTIDWVTKLVEQCRKSNYAVVYPTERQMRTKMYLVFDALMPHGQKAPEPGSTADLLASHVLDATENETSLWHDSEYDPVTSRHYCTARVALGVIN